MLSPFTESSVVISFPSTGGSSTFSAATSACSSSSSSAFSSIFISFLSSVCSSSFSSFTGSSSALAETAAVSFVADSPSVAGDSGWVVIADRGTVEESESSIAGESGKGIDLGDNGRAGTSSLGKTGGGTGDNGWSVTCIGDEGGELLVDELDELALDASAATNFARSLSSSVVRDLGVWAEVVESVLVDCFKLGLAGRCVARDLRRLDKADSAS